ncbi:MAG: hypothetical protein V4439_02855 [Patescibacteria group bacterium]
MKKFKFLLLNFFSGNEEGFEILKSKIIGILGKKTLRVEKIFKPKKDLSLSGCVELLKKHSHVSHSELINLFWHIVDKWTNKTSPSCQMQILTDGTIVFFQGNYDSDNCQIRFLIHER